MAENTSIEWTDHTFNPWWGCAKVSPGCANCYAEGVAERFATGNLWGKDADRKPASEKVWHDPLRWNRAAQKAGRRALVFCASMADVFEDRRDLDVPRERLWSLIRETPWLRWLLLTKRPENFHLLPPEVAALVGLGVSVENQDAADRRIPLLLQTPAAMRFVSCEPLLGPVDLEDVCVFKAATLGRYIDSVRGHIWGVSGYEGGGPPPNDDPPDMARLDWVICGGESGKGARPMHPDWARGLRDQCEAASVPFMLKQWGEWLPESCVPEDGYIPSGISTSTYGGVEYSTENSWLVGKKRAGRLLDGREHLEFPANLREVRP